MPVYEDLRLTVCVCVSLQIQPAISLAGKCSLQTIPCFLAALRLTTHCDDDVCVCACVCECVCKRCHCCGTAMNCFPIAASATAANTFPPTPHPAVGSSAKREPQAGQTLL